MPKKYHISTKATHLDMEYLFKFRITRGENCINCGKCTKVCIYEAHKREEGDPRKMAAPNTAVCRNCFRCIQECPRGALEKSLNQDFLNNNGSYWKSHMLIALWKQAEDGKVPVSGAGYRGPFTGAGFDGMWTDMSEIVRPTRDGIHGREYISTAVELGRKLNHLSFDDKGRLLSKTFDTVHLPLPLVFDLPADNLKGNVLAALAKAAAEIETFLLLPADGLTPEMEPYAGNIVPLLTHQDIDRYSAFLKKARLAALVYDGELLNNISGIKDKMKGICGASVIVRIQAGNGVEETVSRLAHSGVEIIHIAADYRGMEADGHTTSPPRVLKDIIRSVHQRLVSERIRDEVTLIFSGGIAMAEHVPKAMICGADLAAVDLPLLIAMGFRLYEEPEKFLVFPSGLEEIPVPILARRVINLMGAWHSQLLEVMGAMGIREARRLRGETGRAIFFEEVDEDTFGKLFKNREAVNL